MSTPGKIRAVFGSNFLLALWGTGFAAPLFIYLELTYEMGTS